MTTPNVRVWKWKWAAEEVDVHKHSSVLKTNWGDLLWAVHSENLSSLSELLFWKRIIWFVTKRCISNGNCLLTLRGVNNFQHMEIFNTLGHFKSRYWTKFPLCVWPGRDCSAHTRELLPEWWFATKQFGNQFVPEESETSLVSLERLEVQFHWRQSSDGEEWQEEPAVLLNAETSQKPVLHWAPAPEPQTLRPEVNFHAELSQRLFLFAHSLVCAC